MNLRERILSHPAVYRTFKRVVLPNGVLDRLVRDHFVAPDGGRVLDLGCGFGDYAPLFADRCEYLGIDHNESYIETARSMNAGSSAKFIVADVADPIVREHGPFDLVMMSGVLHHLASAEVRDLAAVGAAIDLVDRSVRRDGTGVRPRPTAHCATGDRRRPRSLRA